MTLATAVTPATQEQCSTGTLTTARTPGTLTAETPGVLTASRKNYKSQLEHRGTPTAGMPELMETAFTEGMLTRIGMPATAGEKKTPVAEGTSVVGTAVTAEAVILAVNSSKNNSNSRDSRNSRGKQLELKQRQPQK